MELKTRATVIKYYRSTEISICCRIYFVVNRHYRKKSICLSRIYLQAVAMTLCFELQQSHEMDYVLRDEVYTRCLANTYFARKRSDVGCLYQIDTVSVSYTHLTLPTTPYV